MADENVNPEEVQGTEGQEQQEQQEQKRGFSLVDAHKVFKANGLTAFLDKDSEENFRKEIRKQAFAEFATPLDNVVEEFTGISKEENEKTKDYLSRVLQASKADEGSIEQLRETLEKKYKSNYEQQNKRLDELKSEYEKLQNDYTSKISEYKQKEEQSIVNSFIGGITFNSENELINNAVKNQVIANFFQDHEFAQTEDGSMTVRKNGTVVFDPDENTPTPISVEKFFGDYVKEIKETYNIKETKKRGGKSPDISSGSLAANTQRWKEQVYAKGLYGHEAEALELKKKHGIPLTDAEKKVLSNGDYY
jgi:hypothetical protein